MVNANICAESFNFQISIQKVNKKNAVQGLFLSLAFVLRCLAIKLHMKYFFLAITLLSATIANGQTRTHLQTFVGVEGGILLSMPNIEDKGQQLLAKWTNNAMLGVQLKQELYSNLYLSVGMYTQKYNIGFKFKDDDAASTLKKINLLRFPVNLSYEFPLSFGVPELQLGTSIGFSYLLNNNPGLNEQLKGFIGSDIKNSYYTAWYAYSKERSGYLLNGSLYLNILLARGTVITVGAAYYHGMKELVDLQIAYKKGEGLQEVLSSIGGSGQQLSFWVGVHFPIQKLWQRNNAMEESNQDRFFK